jgi:hypothetical protein
MRFDLLLTDYHRVRWLLWGLLAHAGVLLGLFTLHSKLSVWVLVALPGMLWAAILFWTQLFRRPGWVRVEHDGLSWHSPNEAAPRSISFAKLGAYRFLTSRIGMSLRLCLRSGELVRFESSFSDDFAALWRALDQAVRRHNQTHPDAEIAREKDSLEKFFGRPASTKVLLGLLALSAVWVVRCLSHGADGLAYLALLLLLPYLIVWANFYYDRP